MAFLCLNEVTIMTYTYLFLTLFIFACLWILISVLITNIATLSRWKEVVKDLTQDEAIDALDQIKAATLKSLPYDIASICYFVWYVFDYL